MYSVRRWLTYYLQILNFWIFSVLRVPLGKIWKLDPFPIVVPFHACMRKRAVIQNTIFCLIFLINKSITDTYNSIHIKSPLNKLSTERIILNIFTLFLLLYRFKIFKWTNYYFYKWRHSSVTVLLAFIGYNVH